VPTFAAADFAAANSARSWTTNAAKSLSVLVLVLVLLLVLMVLLPVVTAYDHQPCEVQGRFANRSNLCFVNQRWGFQTFEKVGYWY
jgi:hypothetical protein